MAESFQSAGMHSSGKASMGAQTERLGIEVMGSVALTEGEHY